MVAADDLSSELGHTVLWRPDVDRTLVTDPAAAPRAVARLRPNLVVIDQPGLEPTLALVRRLRDDPATRSTAIAVLSRALPEGAQDRLLHQFRAVGPAHGDVAQAREVHRKGERLRVVDVVDDQLADRRPEVHDLRTLQRPGRHEAPEEVVAALGEELVARRVEDLKLAGELVDQRAEAADPRKSKNRNENPAGEEDGHWRSGVEFLVYRGEARERIAAFVDEEASPARSGAPAAVPLRLRTFDDAREWEEELRASELRKSLILDSALDGIVTVDHEGRILEFNSAARRVFGYTRAEVFGREAVEKLVPPAERAEVRARLREFVASGESTDLGRRREAVAMRADDTAVR